MNIPLAPFFPPSVTRIPVSESDSSSEALPLPLICRFRGLGGWIVFLLCLLDGPAALESGSSFSSAKHEIQVGSDSTSNDVPLSSESSPSEFRRGNERKPQELNKPPVQGLLLIVPCDCQDLVAIKNSDRPGS
jgi:hypothetical protein